MSDELKKVEKYIKPYAIVPVDMNTTGLLVNALKKVVEENNEIKEMIRTAIKAGDWIVDGACDPDIYINYDAKP